MPVAYTFTQSNATVLKVSFNGGDPITVDVAPSSAPNQAWFISNVSLSMNDDGSIQVFYSETLQARDPQTFVSTWTYNLFEQRYDSNGQAIGTKVSLRQLNSSTGEMDSFNDAAANASGTFAYTFTQSNATVLKVSFNGGDPITVDVAPSSAPNQAWFISNVSLSMNDDGSIQVFYSETLQARDPQTFVSTWTYNLFEQRYDSNGQAIGTKVSLRQLNSSTGEMDSFNDAAANASGTFAYTFTQSNATVLKVSFNGGDPITVDVAPSSGEPNQAWFISNVSLSMNDDGSIQVFYSETLQARDPQTFVSTWTYNLFEQRYDSNGQAIGPKVPIDHLTSTIGELDSFNDAAGFTSTLFTTDAEIVNFNNLHPDQITTVNGGADLYNALAGDDTVTLPDETHATKLLPDSNRSWDYSETFNAGPGTDTVIIPNDFGEPGVVQHIDGSAETDPAAKPTDVLKLPGAPNDFFATVQFGSDLANTHTALQVTPDAQSSKQMSGYTIDTVNILKVKFDEQIDNKVQLTHGSEAVEMLQLASEVYGPLPTLNHNAELLASQSNSSFDQTIGVALPAEGRGWHGVSALELGMSPADFGKDGSLHYAFANGFYQAVDDTDALAGDAVEANALVLTGVVNGVKTLSLVFRGTDQLADFNDYGTFSNYYEKFAPLLQGLNSYVADPTNGIAQVLVSGHSLGAGMAQIYMSHHEDTDATVYRAWTDGSPGADSGLPDDRCVNFIHTDDPVTMAPLVGTGSIFALQTFGAYLASKGLTSSFITELLNNLAVAAPKHRVGTDVLLDSDVSSLPTNTDEHNRELYTTDVIRLFDAARAGGPLADTPIAQALLRDDPVIAAEEPSEAYHGNFIQIGVGAPSTSQMHSLLTDDFIVGSSQDDVISIAGSTGQVPIIDGEAGFDTLRVPGIGSAWRLQTTGEETDLFLKGQPGSPDLLVAKLFNIEIVQFANTSRLIDGYLSGTTVFSDDNHNGLPDPTEASTISDETGSFFLSDDTGPLVAFGGTDTSTGLAFKGQLSAPSGSSVITPLTTLMALLATDALAEQKVLSSFGLSSSIDLNGFDPIATAKAGSADGGLAEIAHAKVYDTVSLIASTLVAAGGEFSSGVKDAFADIAAAIGGSGIDLTNQADVAALIAVAAQSEGLTLGQGVADSVAAIIVSSNILLDQQAESGANGEELLNAIAAIERVMQGTASNAIQQAGNDPGQLQALVDAFSGDKLNDAVSTALEHLGVVDTTAPTLSPVADQTNEATSAAGAAGFYTATANDNVDGTIPVVFKEGTTVVHSGDVFGLGTHTITATAVDAAGNQTSQNFKFIVVDTTAPTLTPIADQTLQATTAAGAAAFFTTTATDLVDGTNTVVFKEGDTIVHSGNIFGVGVHTITATAVDAAGNSATDIFEINVLGATSHNHDPIARSDGNGVAKGKSLSVSANKGVLANDSDSDQDHLSVGSVNGSVTNVGHAIKGEYGTLTLNADGSYSYAATTKALPSQIFAQDTFTYTTVDGQGGSDTTTLTFSVFDPSFNYKAGSNTILWGGNGKNVLDGSGGHDVAYGGNGADVLIGGNGDILAGGKGPDQFVFRPDFGVNTILDFDVKNDHLQFDDPTFDSVKSILDHTTNTALGALISDGHGDSVLLVGVHKSQLLAHSTDLLIA